MPNNKCYIYSLNCPVTDLVMYIGKSINPIVRYTCHISAGKKTNPWHINTVNVWIASLRNKNQKPVLKIIQEFDYINDPCPETNWINYYSNVNPMLLNVNGNHNSKLNPYLPKREY